MARGLLAKHVFNTEKVFQSVANNVITIPHMANLSSQLGDSESIGTSVVLKYSCWEGDNTKVIKHPNNRRVKGRVHHFVVIEGMSVQFM